MPTKDPGVITTGSTTQADKVAARRACRRRSKFRTVRFEERLTSAPILGPPDTERTLEDRLAGGRIRIGNDWRIKQRTLRTIEDRRANNYPLRWGAALEVGVVRLSGERVKVQSRIGLTKSGLTAVTIDFLIPGQRTECLERAVVLRSTLNVELVVCSNTTHC